MTLSPLPTIAPLMLDLMGVTLSAEEHELLQHPMVGGVIFFSRNYESSEQVSHLVTAIRQVANTAGKEILLAVDHEGGRVQRFRSGFTRLPALAALGELYTEDPSHALQLSRLHGWLMAAEVKSVGIDFSFAPVLDVNYGVSEVIGDRAFATDSTGVSQLAVAYIDGMRDAGMASTGKHFPGHGAIRADSHLTIPVDNRRFEEILATDMVPFIHLFREGLDAVMPAHVIYSKVDEQPAGFSRIWLQNILRQQLGFEGVIFSDDLSMEGASVAGGLVERAEAALAAGCDMVLACNHRQGVIDILDHANLQPAVESVQRLQRMKGESIVNRSALLESQYWQQAVRDVTALV